MSARLASVSFLRTKSTFWPDEFRMLTSIIVALPRKLDELPDDTDPFRNGSSPVSDESSESSVGVAVGVAAVMTVRFAASFLVAWLREAYGDRSTITFEGPRMTVRDVRAAEVVHESYPASFERLFRDTDHDLCLRVRGDTDLFLDAELVDVAP